MATSASQGTAADYETLKKAYKALKGIVEVAEKEGVAKPEVGDTALKVGSADNKEGAKILATVSGGNPAAGDAGRKQQ